MKNTINHTIQNGNLGFLAAVACTLLFAAATVAPAAAQWGIPPPNWIFELDTTSQHTGVLTNYQQFTTSFTADSTLTYVSFAFREFPAFFAFDDASVKHHGGTNNPELLNDPVFRALRLDNESQPNGALGFRPTSRLLGSSQMARLPPPPMRADQSAAETTGSMARSKAMTVSIRGLPPQQDNPMT